MVIKRYVGIEVHDSSSIILNYTKKQINLNMLLKLYELYDQMERSEVIHVLLGRKNWFLCLNFKFSK